MKIKWTFAEGPSSEVEVNEEIGNFIIDSRRKEENAARNSRRRCYSLDAIDFEGEEFGYNDPNYLEEEETTQEMKKLLSHLTETQRRRLLMYAKGLTYREIAAIEGANPKSVYECVEGARKKLKNFI